MPCGKPDLILAIQNMITKHTLVKSTTPPKTSRSATSRISKESRSHENERKPQRESLQSDLGDRFLAASIGSWGPIPHCVRCLGFRKRPLTKPGRNLVKKIDFNRVTTLEDEDFQWTLHYASTEKPWFDVKLILKTTEEKCFSV